MHAVACKDADETFSEQNANAMKQIGQVATWSRLLGTTGPLAFLFVAISPGLLIAQASADSLAIPIPAPAIPRYDAGDLADLAPPSSAATARQTYGDAAFARRPRHLGSSGQERKDRSYVCLNGTLVLQPECPRGTALKSRNAHVVAPSYVSAPQVFDDPIGLPSPLRSPFVTFFKNAFASPDVP